MSDSIDKNFDDECRREVASLSLSHSEGLPISRRIMVAHGLCLLFPSGSAERVAASNLEATLKDAEERQLQLEEVLKQQP
ncbi:hypothetical protein [Luteolibacter sp. LG18]|uniref:hypothetical protein n=1 Tax=Luteolibacter sp. LG18 TaxID=2819286 RepID=UPI002B2BC205|nr:hypothetical protein llg_07230 [Luteolibacter sp. LG18]BCU79648.1 hypothetical protein llg_43630 [Luteolibacter sp. LG18]